MFNYLKPATPPALAAPLQGPRVYLRAPRLSDWRPWAELRAASRVFLEPWEPSWPEDPFSRAVFRGLLRRHARESRDGTGYSFFIFRRTEDSLLGGVTLSNLRRGIAMSCSLGYWIGASHARQGLMTEALRSLLPLVFDEFGLHRLEAACLPTNVASRRLLGKLGFREEGYACDYLRINAHWHDHVLFALLASDYQETSDYGVTGDVTGGT
ncbi:MAG: GNAT family N-acetyltransferase [Proteobacteria bacterium]|nr:GNAT family N-acetyltransferase [Pseudomonadota bacterium]